MNAVPVIFWPVRAEAGGVPNAIEQSPVTVVEPAPPSSGSPGEVAPQAPPSDPHAAVRWNVRVVTDGSLRQAEARELDRIAEPVGRVTQRRTESLSGRACPSW